MALPAALLLGMLSTLAECHSLTQIDLYEMEISEECYYFPLFPCRWLEGYFKRQLVCLWLGRKREDDTSHSSSLNSRCTFPFLLLLNEEGWRKQRIKVCFLAVSCRTAEAKWSNKFSFRKQPQTVGLFVSVHAWE